MKLLLVNETIEKMNQKKVQLSQEAKLFIVQFAVHTEDQVLTDHLICKMAASNDSESQVMEEYAVYCKNTGWVSEIEKVLVTIALYRAEELQALSHLSELLITYGMDVEFCSDKDVEDKVVSVLKATEDAEQKQEEKRILDAETVRNVMKKSRVL